MASGAKKPNRNPDLSGFTPAGGGLIDKQQLDEARRRADKTSGIAMLVIGIFATITSMTSFTENALAMQYSQLFAQYGISPYVRPAALPALSMVGIIAHPALYATTLYLVLLRWKRNKRAMWLIVIGAILGMGLTFLLVTIGISLHPELIAAAQSGMLPGTPATP
ncbi:hypothetical protein JRG19_03160 [Pseudoclavibacter alba]|uniref:DUF6264 family protein n=1 Tax=Pseudoclavibacter albus TaxID=272241 RepID=UPI0019D07E0A|nr:DUF6264 family protein [Pseudoclavibacter alba]MBN6777549.1 hypothetical protein [Pseudoclavibacter alba]